MLNRYRFEMFACVLYKIIYEKSVLGLLGRCKVSRGSFFVTEKCVCFQDLMKRGRQAVAPVWLSSNMMC